MRKIREVLRLSKDLQLSDRQVAQSCRMAHGTVANYLLRAKHAGLTWPLPEDLTDSGLEELLFAKGTFHGKHNGRAEPDWKTVHLELKRKGVTLYLLWDEYRQSHENSLGYSSFTDRYRAYRKTVTPVTLRQDHKAGEKAFVDYAGMTLPITDASSGDITQAQVFVGVLGASNYTYCEVTPSQTIPDWLGSHRRMLEFFGGSPEIIVPDNLKSGVKSACYFEPELNPAYAEFAQHYGVAIVPTRVRKPRDKAKVEAGVRFIEEQILAALRNRTFFSVREANDEVQDRLVPFNAKAFQKLEGSRKSVFEAVDKPALKPLPLEPYVISQWKKARVGTDYHIEVEKHYYSVPFEHAGKQVEVRLTTNVLEVYLDRGRIASHARKPDLPRYKGRHSTLKEHMPPQHQKGLEWTPQRYVDWAAKTGPSTAQVVEKIMASRDHPQQGFRACRGLIQLGEKYGPSRLELACRRALAIRGPSYRTVKSILMGGLETLPLPEDPPTPLPVTPIHKNVRGSSYYKTSKSDDTSLPSTPPLEA